MWFDLNGHHTKSQNQESEVFNEPKTKETELHEIVQAGCRQAGIGKGHTCVEVTHRLGIAISNVTRWVSLHQSDHPEFTESDVPRSVLENKTRRMGKENQWLRMEREILKKAAAFFAKESNCDTTSSG